MKILENAYSRRIVYEYPSIIILNNDKHPTPVKNNTFVECVQATPTCQPSLMTNKDLLNVASPSTSWQWSH